jgi:predicted permease
VRQLLIETLSISALGAFAGLLFAFWAVGALTALYLPVDAAGLSSTSSGLNISTTPDLRVLLFTIAVTVVTGLLFGLAPALQTTKPDVGKTLKDQAGSVVRGGNNATRKTLVIVQVALSFLLVLGAGLFLRTLNKLSGLGPGFPTEKLMGFEIDSSLGGYTDAQSKAFYQRLSDSLAAVPGVRTVGLASTRILEDNESDSTMTVEGYTPAKQGDNAEPFMNDISPNYFATMGVPIVAGRDFTAQDNHEVFHGPRPEDWVPTVVIINEKFAQKYFPGQNPLGRHMGYGGDPGTKMDMEIIGVVKDIKYTSLRDEIPEQAFLPYLGERNIGGMTAYLRTTANPTQLVSVVRQKVRELDATLPVYALRTMDEQISNSLSTERMIASLSSVFGIFATLLAAIGLYGVMAYTVARRTREIGIRMALGAERGRVIWMVMQDALLLIAGGVAIGLPMSLVLTRLVQSQLYGVTAHDPSTMIVAVVCLASVACAAGWIPAYRASRLDPVIALRHE